MFILSLLFNRGAYKVSLQADFTVEAKICRVHRNSSILLCTGELHMYHVHILFCVDSLAVCHVRMFPAIDKSLWKIYGTNIYFHFSRAMESSCKNSICCCDVPCSLNLPSNTFYNNIILQFFLSRLIIYSVSVCMYMYSPCGRPCV